MKKLFRAIACLLISSLHGTPEIKRGEELFAGVPSGDFVIRWAFQKACDHVFDPRTNIYVWPTSARGVSFNPERVKAGDSIFVRKLDLFFKDLHPRISHPYILVTHGEHLDKVKEHQLAYLDDPRIIAWFGIHPCKKAHPKYHPIPLGIVQDPQHYKKRETLAALMHELRASAVKRDLVYMNFAADDKKPERKKLRLLLGQKSFCKRGPRKPFVQYLEEMAGCLFTLAPGGLGPDSYRVWEALLVGSIPIVKSSSIDPLLQDLPVLIVSSWSDVTKEFLEQQYKQITSRKYPLEKLYMNYWLAQIKGAKERFLAQYAAQGGL